MSASTDARVSAELLGYRIEALLGRGGMGVVYRAYDPRLKRNVALKLIAPELSEDARFRERFLSESELAASLEHPNVVPIHDAGEVDGQLYLVMRYVEGGELKTLLQRQAPLEPGRALAVCGQVGAALDAAHARGLVHRDVKPSNVLLGENDHVYLTDFGLSRRLADPGIPGAGPGLSLGTPAYAAPEQIQGGDVDGRADVYSLACVLYECLTGEPPYSRDSELALLWAHLQEPPPKPSEHTDLPPEMDAVVATALAKDPDNRYASCGELTEAASNALGLHRPVTIHDRKALILTAVGVAIAAAAVLAGVLLSQGGGGNPRAKPNLAVETNTLVRIDSKTNKIADVIPVGRDPASLAFGGHTVWVYNYADHTVEGIDARTNAIVVPPTAIAGDPPSEAGIFREVAADREGAWVLSVQEPSGRGWLTRVRRDVPSTDQIELPATPVAIAFGDGAIWVTTTKGRTGTLLRVDPRTRAVKALPLPGLDATPNWIAVGAGAVWLTDAAADASTTGSGAIGVPDSRLFRIDPRTMRITGRRGISCHQAMCAVAIGPGSVSIVENPWAGPYRVLRVDPGTLRKIGLIATPRSVLGTVFFGGFGFVGLDGNTIWYVGDGAVRVDARTSRIIARIHLLDYSSIFALPSASVAGGGSVWITVAAPR